MHNVSPLKKSKNKSVGYFNCNLQTQGQTFQAVAFKLETKDTLDEASVSKSPVKLSGFKRKDNFHNNKIQDIEINKKTNVTLLSKEQAPFRYHTITPDVAELVDVKTLLDSG